MLDSDEEEDKDGSATVPSAAPGKSTARIEESFDSTLQDEDFAHVSVRSKTGHFSMPTISHQGLFPIGQSNSQVVGHLAYGCKIHDSSR